VAERLTNDGSPFAANGFLGANCDQQQVFGSQVVYNRGGTNPQGQVTVTITSCSNPDGSPIEGCSKDIEDKDKWRTYQIKSNAISELSLISGSASFGSKTNVYELKADGTKVSLDGGNTMQLVFTPTRSNRSNWNVYSYYLHQFPNYLHQFRQGVCSNNRRLCLNRHLQIGRRCLVLKCLGATRRYYSAEDLRENCCKR
jgi:hypothetical protein